MTLIDGDKIVTAQLYDDEHEEFIEKEMSIIDYVNAYTNEGVTITDDVLDKIRAEMEQIKEAEYQIYGKGSWRFVDKCLEIIDKYKASPIGAEGRDKCGKKEVQKPEI